MDLDNITDIEVLRNIAKRYMVKVKQNFRTENDNLHELKKDHWYEFDQDEYGVTVYFTDNNSVCFTYTEAKEYLDVAGTTANI